MSYCTAPLPVHRTCTLVVEVIRTSFLAPGHHHRVAYIFSNFNCYHVLCAHSGSVTRDSVGEIRNRVLVHTLLGYLAVF